MSENREDLKVEEAAAQKLEEAGAGIKPNGAALFPFAVFVAI